MTPDMINGLFELFGAIMLSLNLVQLHKDKEVKGVSVLPIIFFTSWGFWNLYFYPTVGAYYSFFAGIAVVIVNSIWLGMLWYYKHKK